MKQMGDDRKQSCTNVSVDTHWDLGARLKCILQSMMLVVISIGSKGPRQLWQPTNAVCHAVECLCHYSKSILTTLPCNLPECSIYLLVSVCSKC